MFERQTAEVNIRQNWMMKIIEDWETLLMDLNYYFALKVDSIFRYSDVRESFISVTYPQVFIVNFTVVNCRLWLN
jgi:hypothetical protein